MFAALLQDRGSVKASSKDFYGQLRIALPDGVTPSRLSALLAFCRQEEPGEYDALSAVLIGPERNKHQDGSPVIVTRRECPPGH